MFVILILIIIVVSLAYVSLISIMLSLYAFILLFWSLFLDSFIPIIWKLVILVHLLDLFKFIFIFIRYHSLTYSNYLTKNIKYSKNFTIILIFKYKVDSNMSL